MFADDALAQVQQRCAAVWRAELQLALAPQRAEQRVVGVYVIRDEHERLWSQLAPLLRPDVVAYGFDFNPAPSGAFSARGSASHAMLVDIGANQWRYFPARLLVMRDAEFSRLMQPPLLELRRAARQLVWGRRVARDCSAAGTAPHEPVCVPRERDTELAARDAAALFGDKLAPTRAHWTQLLVRDAELAARCAERAAVGDIPTPRRDGTLVHGAAQARYYDVETHVCTAKELRSWSRERQIERRTRHFPRTITHVAAHMADEQQLCVLWLKHGVIHDAVPLAQRTSDQRGLLLDEARVGSFAPRTRLPCWRLWTATGATFAGRRSQSR